MAVAARPGKASSGRAHLARARRALAAEPALLVIVVLLAGAYAAYALIRHAHFGSGLDLGIFDQGIWHYSRFETPGSTISGVPNLLGDHFHPILVLLAPLYWIWADPRTLLIAQAVLVAASVIPVFLFARPRLGRPGAYLLAVAYGTFWGLQTGVGYDFHEVAFAPLLIALAILFIDRRSWAAYFMAIALLLCVKENQALLVFFLGVYLLTLREVRRGAITMVAALGWYLLVMDVFIPEFSQSGGYTHWTYGQFGKNLPSAVEAVVREPWRPFEVMFRPAEKARTIAYLFVPFLGLTLCSRLAILTIPLLAERFLADATQFWGPSFHYSMAIAPVLAMGAAAGVHNLAGFVRPDRRRAVVTVGAAGMLVVGTVLTLRNIPGAPLKEATKASFYRDPGFAKAIRRVLAHVPPHASVATQDVLVPRLGHRKLLIEIGPSAKEIPDYLVANVLMPPGSPGPNATYRDMEANTARRLLGYDATYYDAGWVVARLRPRSTPNRSPPNLALQPIPRRRAERLLSDYFAWERAYNEGFKELVRCAGLRGARDPRAAPCLRTAGTRLRAVEGRIAATLAGTRSALVGGCRELAGLALRGAVAFARDFERVRELGLHGSGRALAAAGQRLGYDLAEIDLPGRFGRFLILCYPR